MTHLRYHAAALVLLACTCPAQIGGNGSQGPFTPTSSTTLDTSANGGVFQFTRISIPDGVTVTAAGPNPAVLLSQGSVDIAGALVADGAQPGPGPGGFRGGQPGFNGFGGKGDGPGGGRGMVVGISPAEPGAHATSGAGSAPLYGAALPFDLRGGSGGGGAAVATASATPKEGGGGGGTIVVLADGAISITGRVSARGGDTHYRSVTPVEVPGAPGSGGSILIRSLAGVVVTGVVDAHGGLIRPLSPPENGGAGFVRIDAFAVTPTVSGQVIPAPTILELPHLRELSPPRVGQLWNLRVSSVPGDGVGVFFALGGASVPTPFGTLVLDGQAGLVLGGKVSVPAVGVDPLAALDFPVPNDPALRGFTIHVQAFNVFGAVRALRLSNGIVSTVQ